MKKERGNEAESKCFLGIIISMMKFAELFPFYKPAKKNLRKNKQ